MFLFQESKEETMGILTVKDIIEATGGELLSENSKVFSGVSIDSRTIEEGELFFAIRGERFDGHDYLEKALVKGSGAIVDKKPASIPADKVIIYVSDTLKSLQDLAHFIRMKKNIPVIAVTGSNGKTTTKEMIHLVLSSRFRALKNKGNLNNHIGLPLTLVRLNPDDEVVVVEMGMNAAGEIRRLCEIAAPSHGVITNIGTAHVGMLGSQEAVRAAKLEILEGLSVAVVNADDIFLMQGLSEIKIFDGQIITFGINNEASVMASGISTMQSGSVFTLDIKGSGSASVRLNVHGLFNVYNALAAAAICFSLGMSIDEIKAALETYRAFPMRFEVTERGGITIINDSYNANPSSVRESVYELKRLSAGRRCVAILGDMRELGEFADDEHRGTGEMITEAGVDVFIAVGEKMGLAAEAGMKARGEKTLTEIFMFPDANEARGKVSAILEKGDIVLIKGSRSMAMERVMEGITDAV